MSEVAVAEREEEAFYTPESLARKLALSKRTVMDMLARGDIPSYKIGAARRIDPADVDSFLADRREERTAA